MDFDIKIRDNDEKKSFATVIVKLYEDRESSLKYSESLVLLHSFNCEKCNENMASIDDVIHALEHEYVESLVYGILHEDFGEYNEKGFDKLSHWWHDRVIEHKCNKSFMDKIKSVFESVTTHIG